MPYMDDSISLYVPYADLMHMVIYMPGMHTMYIGQYKLFADTSDISPYLSYMYAAIVKQFTPFTELPM